MGQPLTYFAVYLGAYDGDKARDLEHEIRPHVPEGWAEVVVAGLLSKLWHRAAKEGEDDGRLGTMPGRRLARVLGWPGDPEVLIRALEVSGWIERIPDETEESRRTYRPHDWGGNQPAIRERLRKRDYQRQRRGTDPDPEPPPQKAAVPAASPEHPPETKPRSRNIGQVGREVGREVDQRDPRPGGSATRAPAPPPPGDDPPPPEEGIPPLTLEAPEALPAPDVVVEVPCKGRQGRPYGVTRAELDAWAKAYPGVDVEVQTRKAAGWARNRPSRQKAHKNIPRWLCDVWFAPELGRGGRAPPGGAGKQAKLEARNAEVLDDFTERWQRELDEDRGHLRALPGGRR